MLRVLSDIEAVLVLLAQYNLSVDSKQNVKSKRNKKFELILTRRAKAYSSSCS